MFRKYLRQFRTDPFSIFGTVAGITAISVFGTTSLFFLASVINAIIVNGSALVTELNLFITIFGFLFLLAFFTLVTSITFSIERRIELFKRLRTIGVTYRKLKWYLLSETSLICVIALVVGIFPGQIFAGMILDRFITAGIVDDYIVMTYDISIYVSIVVATFMVSWSAMFMSFIPLKKIIVDNADHKSTFRKALSIIWKVFGFILIVLPIVIFSTVDMSGDGGMMLIPAAFLWVGGLTISGKTLWYFVFSMMYKWTGIGIFASLRQSAPRLSGVITSVAFILSFNLIMSASIAINMESNHIALTKYYGDNFIYEYDSDIEASDEISKVEMGESPVFAPSSSEAYYTDVKIIEGPLFYNVEVLESQEEGVEVDNSNGYQKINIQEGYAIVTTNYDSIDDVEIGSEIGIEISGGRKSLVVAAIVKEPLDNDNFPEIYINYLDIDGHSSQYHDTYTEHEIVSPIEQTGSEFIKIDVNKIFEKNRRTANTALYIINAIVLTFTAVSALNLMQLYMHTKRKQIDIQFKIGCTRRRILFMSILETSILTFLGVVFGLVSSIVYSAFYSHDSYVNLSLISNVGNTVIIIALIFVFSIITTISSFRLDHKKFHKFKI